MPADPAPLYEALAEALRADEPVALATVIDGVGVGSRLLVRPGHEPLGSLGGPELDDVATRDVLGELELGQTCVRHYGAGGEQRMEDLTLFVESFAPQPRMLIFGAVDFTASLARVAKVLGYKVVVCDARKVFATPKRFPMADEIRVEWPDSGFDAYRSGAAAPEGKGEEGGRPRVVFPRPAAAPRPPPTPSASSPTTPSSTCPPWCARCRPTWVTSA